MTQANRRQDKARSMTFGSYLQSQWLPPKKAALRVSTYAGYRRNVEPHITPTLGRVPIRRLRDKHVEELYERLAHPTGDTRALSPKTVLEIHLIVRAALADALRDEYMTRNVALGAQRRRHLPTATYAAPAPTIAGSACVHRSQPRVLYAAGASFSIRT